MKNWERNLIRRANNSQAASSAQRKCFKFIDDKFEYLLHLWCTPGIKIYILWQNMLLTITQRIRVYLSRPASNWRYVSTYSCNNSASLAEPGRPLPGSLHYSLVFVLLAWHLALVQDDGLRSRRPQRTAFTCFNLLANQRSLPAHLSVTEATQDVFLLQVTTLWTRLDVILRERETEDADCVSNNVMETLLLYYLKHIFGQYIYKYSHICGELISDTLY